MEGSTITFGLAFARRLTRVAEATQPNAVSNAIGYAKFYSRSHDAVIRVFDKAENLIETHEHAGDFREP